MVQLTIHSDGGSRGNPGPAAYGVAFLLGGEVVKELTEFLGTATNNEAEYSGLVAALRTLPEVIQQYSIDSVVIKLDSNLVVQQVNGVWKVKEARIATFVAQARQLLKIVPIPVKIMYVPRAENAVADALVNQCLDAALA